MADEGLEQVVASQLKEVRRRRGLSQEALSALLSELGVPLHQTAIAKIENQKRGVAVGELVALALALNVTPLRLLLPDGKDLVFITPAKRHFASTVWGWMIGNQSLAAASTVEDGRRAAEAYRAELPPEEARMRLQPAIRATQRLMERVREVVDRLDDDTPAKDPAAVARLDAARTELSRVTAELDDLERVLSLPPAARSLELSDFRPVDERRGS